MIGGQTLSPHIYPELNGELARLSKAYQRLRADPERTAEKQILITSANHLLALTYEVCGVSPTRG